MHTIFSDVILWNHDVCFFMSIYEMEQFKLKVERCFLFDSQLSGGFGLFVTGRSHFFIE